MFSDISSRVQENLSGVRVVRAYVQEEAELRPFEQLNQDYIGENIRLARLIGRSSCRCSQALIGVTIADRAVGRRQRGCWRGQHQPGQLRHVQHLHGHAGLAHDRLRLGGESGAARHGLARADQRDSHGAALHRRAARRRARSREPLRGEIEFRGVAVQYPAGKALDGIDLRIPAGATVAIVGHTGSGKTHAGAADSPADGSDRRQRSARRHRRARVLARRAAAPDRLCAAGDFPVQRHARRRTSPSGSTSATEEEIRRAAELAGLGPDIESFPDGLDTMIGERGITLSGGQKQRTAIARAILRDPRILILDDALSSVDTVTEERILNGLAALMKGRTTILISHRVSTVRQRRPDLRASRTAASPSKARTPNCWPLGGYYADLYQKQLLEEELEAI